MKVRIKRIDKNLPLPEYKTAGAVGFDFMARVSMTILPKGIARVPLNIALEPPEGYFLMVAARGSLPKKGLMLANSVGIGDQDFSGNADEYWATLYNFTDHEVSVERGERLVQGIFKKYGKAEWEEVDDMGNRDRGGFGTTGLT
ncbi:dUTPase [Candidatus Giovannonibacteria bacterium RIFCSPLOWO2_02_FULL_43_11b]|uniref:dUTP diphosphatase n=1 Tax=Candidatus Giovannonibacteria bacterium RIFCSPHIGHO2_12_FULL_43_15 TaxID=1798341 RepID=A0A1F5WNL3_9BACT|nr:MAG: dUTPase [Candidatus Giovannonibacteria bacterium RIFCSPHIGHO2_02_FULL_43_32]OGF77210.1 MAG: dUTPase [Candidatus Giovannonibacteria bacterium RIFCSPHIGHO2_12_FULL_43_15]OGF90582.1 MAG: dUTPase [Candidatus Giovannonibacteria bacterium RIFCSPLOWO2_02_FULL_43_11b]